MITIDDNEGKIFYSTKKFKFFFRKDSLNKRYPIYSYEDILSFKKEQKIINYKITIVLVLGEKKDKNWIRIKSIVEEDKKKEAPKTKILEVLPYLNDLIFKMDVYFKNQDILDRKSNSKKDNTPCSLEELLKNCLPLEFILDENHLYIPIETSNNLSEQEVKSLLNNSENNQKKFFEYSSIKMIDSFLEELKYGIENEASNEGYFKDLLAKKYQEILFLIFDIDDSFTVKTEKEINEIIGNKIDISVGENFVIELKTPNTKLFSFTENRKNISGIHTKLASATNQLLFYVGMVNHRNQISYYENKKNKIFTENLEYGINDKETEIVRGVLIIGSDDKFVNRKAQAESEKNESKRECFNAWKIYREAHKVTIMTYNDLYRKVERIRKQLMKKNK